MKPWPLDPIRQHNRLIAALCDDMASGIFSLDGPNVSRVAEISRQVNEQSTAPVGSRPNKGRGGGNISPTNDER